MPTPTGFQSAPSAPTPMLPTLLTSIALSREANGPEVDGNVAAKPSANLTDGKVTKPSTNFTGVKVTKPSTNLSVALPVASLRVQSETPESAMSSVTDSTRVSPKSESWDAQRLRKEYINMTWAVGLNIAAVAYTPTLMATAGTWGTGIFFGTALVSGLIVAPISFQFFGSRDGMALALAFNTLQALLRVIAVYMCEEFEPTHHRSHGVHHIAGTSPVESRGILLVLGSEALGGFAFGMLWPCRGACFCSFCERLATLEGRAKALVTAESASTWAFILFGIDSAVAASRVAMTDYAGLSHAAVALVYFVAALAANIAFRNFVSFSCHAAESPFMQKTFRTVEQTFQIFLDVKFLCLQGLNVSFWMALAWFDGYMNRNALNGGFFGFSPAIISGLISAWSLALRPLALRVGKGPCFLLASMALLSLGALSMLFVGAVGSAWETFGLHVLLGITRSVYESTYSAVIADFFSAGRGIDTFSALFFIGIASSAVGTSLGDMGQDSVQFFTFLAFAAVTFPGYILASCVHSRAEATEATSGEHTAAV